MKQADASSQTPNQLSAKKSDLSEWYHQILFLADIVDIRYDVKGMNVWKGYGYKTMRLLKSFWDDALEDMGVQELYFPQVIPISYCEQNPEWWSGFKHEGYRVIAGEKNEIQGALRPTGEAAMYPMYAKWIKTHTDLPFLGYETVSSFRYETRHTRPLIRDREITLWHEIHTVHATKEDCLEESKRHITFYQDMWNYVALAPLIVTKPAWEVFPGAVGGIEFYNLSPDGKAMENGSVNILGQAYAKKFNIIYKDKDGEDQFAWQVCTGNGARLLAGVLMEHGDDKGLVIPPNIAPIQVVIVPIFKAESKETILAKAKELKDSLQQIGIRAFVDDSTLSVGKKFFEWELKGVPVRLELGPKDLEQSQTMMAIRHSGTKAPISLADIQTVLPQTLGTIQQDMLKNSQKNLKSRTVEVATYDELTSQLRANKCCKFHWCGSGECYDDIKKIYEGAEIFGTDYFEQQDGECIVCGKKADQLAYAAKTY